MAENYNQQYLSTLKEIKILKLLLAEKSFLTESEKVFLKQLDELAKALDNRYSEENFIEDICDDIHAMRLQLA